MKNKKGSMEMSVGTIVTIVLLMTVLILGLVLVKNIFDKPEFKVTTKECWNVTGEIGFDNFQEEDFGMNENILSYEIKRYGIYKLDDLFCIDYLRQQGHKDFILHSCEYYEGGIGLEIIGSELIDEGDYFSYGEKIEYIIYPEKIEEIFPKEFTFDEEKVYLEDGKIINANTFFFIVADVIKNEEVCEDVEVDLKKNPCIEKTDGECWGDIISIEWLDGNCECLLCDTNGENCEGDKQYCGSVNKYKCGDYQVEVIR